MRQGWLETQFPYCCLETQSTDCCFQEQPLNEKIELAKRMRGLTPVGADRLHRSYFVIPSMPDVVFVQRLAFPPREQTEVEVEYMVEEWPALEVPASSWLQASGMGL